MIAQTDKATARGIIKIAVNVYDFTGVKISNNPFDKNCKVTKVIDLRFLFNLLKIKSNVISNGNYFLISNYSSNDNKN